MAKRTPKELAEADAASMSEAREELRQRRQERKRTEELHGHKRREKAYHQEIETLENALAVALDMREDSAVYRPMKVKTREKGVAREGTAVLLLSDLHPEEVVESEKVSGLNEFNPSIAEERIDRLIEGTRWTLETVRAKKGKAGYDVRDFILAILGDLISNTIHPDLAESNAMGPADACNFVFDLIQRVIDALLEDKRLERVLIPCCHGNHDRLSQKPRHQTKAETSLSTIIYSNLRRLYRDESRVQFDIARGNLLYTEVYGKMIRWHHGDDIKYHGGVGGLTIPMRKAIDSWNRSVDAALTCVGHWHQVTDHSDFVVNGSLIGYGPYAQAIKARYEPAAQAFFVLDKEHGKRFFTAIDVQGAKQWR